MCKTLRLPAERQRKNLAQRYEETVRTQIFSDFYLFKVKISLAEAEICQLADIQDSIQRMREGEGVAPSQSDKQSVEARLSSSCPSLVVDSGEEGAGAADTPDGGRRARGRAPHFKDQRDYRKRSGRQRSPSVSTGDSEEEAVEAGRAVRPGGG